MKMQAIKKIATTSLLAGALVIGTAAPSHAAVRVYPAVPSEGKYGYEITSSTQSGCNYERASVIRGVHMSGWVIYSYQNCWYDSRSWSKKWRATLMVDRTPMKSAR